MAAPSSGKQLIKLLAVLGIGAGVVCYSFRWFYLRYIKQSKRRGHSKGLVKVLFFPDSQVSCRAHFTQRHGCTSQRCRFSHDDNNSYAQLLRFLKDARCTIDLCVFTISCSELADVIVDLYNKGVVVRVITDDEQIDASGSQIERFRREGIQVRHDRSSYLMHHKFVILDQRLLINGSFNWTRQAITGNNENLIITDQPDLINAFQSEFDRLWDIFDPKKYTESKS